MAKNIPVNIWIPRQTPNKDPKFHKYDKFTGAGKSLKELNVANKGFIRNKFPYPHYVTTYSMYIEATGNLYLYL